MPILSVAAAYTAIQTQVPALPPTRLALRELTGSVLAEDICMERDQPPFDRVTMDGIALSSQTPNVNRRWRIAGTQAAGTPPLALQNPGDCIEVMTGAELPAGCDAVIPVERIQIVDSHAQVEAGMAIEAGMNVHRRGSDARANSNLLHPGQRLTATEVAVLASAGYAQAQVRRSPRIAVISTGDELVEPGLPIQTWQVRRSNTYALLAALQQHGHTHLVDAHIADDLSVLRPQLQALLAANDVLILSGGVSMGRFDFVPQVLSELGVQCVFHKIAQRPGKPMWFGVRDDGKAVYALPGNPVSTLICLHRFVLPGLLRAMGMQEQPVTQIALADACKAHDELTLFVPVKLQSDTQGFTRAMPCPTRGSGDFISLLDTDGFVELAPAQSMIAAGTVVPLFRW
ncbi:MAG: molybdopterin molybdotransferase MoeA [Steroidobacteraceae bacterium]